MFFVFFTCKETASNAHHQSRHTLALHVAPPLYGVDDVCDAAGKGALEDSITLRGGTTRIVTTAAFRARDLGIVFAEGPQRRSAERLAELAEDAADGRSEEDTSELQSLMRISYAVLCLKTKKHHIQQ